MKWREQPSGLLGRESDAAVLHLETQSHGCFGPGAIGAIGLIDPYPDPAAGGELQRVADQVAQHLQQPQRVAAQGPWQIRRDCELQCQPALGRLEREQHPDFLEQRVELQGQRFDLESPGLDFRVIQDVIEHAEQGGARAVDLAQVVALQRVEFGLEQQPGQPDHRIHRRADLVAHVGEELALGPVGGFGSLLGGGQFERMRLQLGGGLLCLLAGRQQLGLEALAFLDHEEDPAVGRLALEQRLFGVDQHRYLALLMRAQRQGQFAHPAHVQQHRPDMGLQEDAAGGWQHGIQARGFPVHPRAAQHRQQLVVERQQAAGGVCDQQCAGQIEERRHQAFFHAQILISGAGQVALHGRDHELRLAHVCRVAFHVEQFQLAAAQLAVQVVTDRDRHQRIVAVLQDQTGLGDPGQIGAVVGKEGRFGKGARHHRVGRAEAVDEGSRDRIIDCRTGRQWRQVVGPADVVHFHQRQQALEVGPVEAAVVVRGMVQEAGIRAEQHQTLEQVRAGDRGQQADVAADRMRDQRDAAQPQRVADLDHVLGVAIEPGIALAVERGRIGLAAADIVEQHLAVRVLECPRDPVPHVLVAAEAVAIQDHGAVLADFAHMVALPDIR